MSAPATLPSAFELSAALHVVALCGSPPTRFATLEASFAHVATGGLIRREDLAQAFDLLGGYGLLVVRDGVVDIPPRVMALNALPPESARSALLKLLFEISPPVWAPAAAVGQTLTLDLIPDFDLRLLTTVFPDPDEREAVLINLGRRFDDEADRELGEVGEEVVAAACRAWFISMGRDDLAAKVRHVSLLSDQLGYDITCPSVNGETWRLEVKATRRVSPAICVNISRNEANAAARIFGWALVICQATMEGGARIVGWCPGPIATNRLPTDVAMRSEWTSARLFINQEEVCAGLPDLQNGPPG